MTFTQFKYILLASITFAVLSTLPASVTLADENAQEAGNQGSQTKSTGKANQAKSTKKPQTDTKQIDAWVEQLGHKRITKRSQAKKKLLSAGSTAILSLAKAALSDKREAIERSIDILGALAQSKDEKTADAAKVTLKMLSESKKPSTAARAKSVLNTKEAKGIQPFKGWDKPSNQFGGGGQNRSVSVSNINGVRSIRITERGSETLIEDVPGGIRVTTKTGEKDPVAITAKNEADLKKRSPEAFALYQQYANQAGGFGIGNGIGNASGNRNGGFGNGGGANININGGGNSSASQRMVEQLKELKKRMAGNPAMQRLLDQQIKSHRKRRDSSELR